MSEPLLNVMKIMLLAGLYLFFVRVLWAVSAELRDPRTRVTKRGSAASVEPTPRATPRANPSARVTTPPVSPARTDSTVGQLTFVEPAALAGRSWAIGDDLTLGRSPTCGIQLDDTYVSGVHARIFLANGSFHIEDLDSRNGTVLNGEAVTATTALVPGDHLRFGATLLEFS